MSVCPLSSDELPLFGILFCQLVITLFNIKIFSKVNHKTKDIKLVIDSIRLDEMEFSAMAF